MSLSRSMFPLQHYRGPDFIIAIVQCLFSSNILAVVVFDGSLPVIIIIIIGDTSCLALRVNFRWLD